MPLGGEKSAVGYSVCDGCPRVQKNIIFLQTGVLTAWLVKLAFSCKYWCNTLYGQTYWATYMLHLYRNCLAMETHAMKLLVHRFCADVSVREGLKICSYRVSTVDFYALGDSAL